MPDTLTVFDRRSVRLHRDRAASKLPAHDFLLREIAHRLVDRLDDVRRKFPVALDLGCRHGHLAGELARRGGVRTLVHCDLSLAMVRRAAGARLVADEEALPFAAASFDLVVSLLNLHWVNDLPGALLQIRQVLKADGLFLAAMFGGETLKELRRSLAEAEIGEEGGLSPRISPFAEVRDAGNLLQRAGFALPVADMRNADRLLRRSPGAAGRPARHGRDQRRDRAPQDRQPARHPGAGDASAIGSFTATPMAGCRRPSR